MPIEDNAAQRHLVSSHKHRPVDDRIPVPIIHEPQIQARCRLFRRALQCVVFVYDFFVSRVQWDFVFFHAVPGGTWLKMSLLPSHL